MSLVLEDVKNLHTFMIGFNAKKCICLGNFRFCFNIKHIQTETGLPLLEQTLVSTVKILQPDEYLPL